MPGVSANELPGISEIGCGYDVNGDYASTLSLKIPLFSLYKDGETQVTMDQQHADTTTYRLPSTVAFHRSNTTDYSFASGSDSKELLKSLNTKTSLEGSYGPFSASCSVDFDSSDLTTKFYTFSRVQYNVNLYTLQLGPNDQLKNMLTDRAKHDINNMAPNELFDNYGCYFLGSLVMGGRSVMGSSTSKYSYHGTQSLEVVAKASFSNLIGSVSGSVDTKVASDVKTFNESSKISITTKGGDSQYGSELPGKFQDWSKSVQQFPLFVDFLNAQSLRGIWNLADTPQRVQALQSAAQSYLASHASSISQIDGPVLQGKWLQLTKASSDEGGGAKQDVSFWKPQLGSSDTDWHYVGQTAFGDYGNHANEKGLVVREIVKGVLGDISNWERVWDDRGSGKSHDYSIWHPIPASTVDYVPLGSFFRGPVNGQDAPQTAEVTSLKVLHKSFVKPGSVGNQIWNDHGTGAKMDGSVWQINADPAALFQKTFVGSGNHSKPDRPVFNIKKDAVAIDVVPNVDAVVKSRTNAALSKLASSNKMARPVFVGDKTIAPTSAPTTYIHYQFDKSTLAK